MSLVLKFFNADDGTVELFFWESANNCNHKLRTNVVDSCDEELIRGQF